MRDKIFIYKSFGHFFRFNPIRLILLFLVTLFKGLTQGFTIILLIPLLALLEPNRQLNQENSLTENLSLLVNKMGGTLNLETILIFYAVCLMFVAFLNYFQSIGQGSYQQDFSSETRKRLFRKIITSDWTFLNGKSKHSHLQILTTEIPKMANYYYFFLSLAGKIIFVIAHIVLALFISVSFTLFVVFLGLILSLLLRKYIRRSRKMGGNSIHISRNLLKRIDDFWLMVKIAKVHQTEPFYYEKYDRANRQMVDNQNRQIRNRAMPQLLFTLTGVLALIVLVYLGYMLAHIPFASLCVLILLFARIFPQIAGLNNDLNQMASNEESVKLVLEMDKKLVEKPFEDSSINVRLDLNKQLDIRNLTFGYTPDNLLFDRFSASIPAHAITGITGKSGVGKTTLLDIVAGLQHSDSLFVDGIPLQGGLWSAWRHSLGYLPQDSFFIDGTIRENLIWDSAENSTDEELYNVLSTVNALDLVLRQKNGLDTNLSNYQYHFSGGERQRLALARVLLRKPKLLLLDEATSALDSQNEKWIMESLIRLKKETTILFVTHREYLQVQFDQTIHLNENQATTSTCIPTKSEP